MKFTDSRANIRISREKINMLVLLAMRSPDTGTCNECLARPRVRLSSACTTFTTKAIVAVIIRSQTRVAYICTHRHIALSSLASDNLSLFAYAVYPAMINLLSGIHAVKYIFAEYFLIHTPTHVFFVLLCT